MLPELRDILFLDIETVGKTDDFEAMDERLKVLWSRKASFLRRDTAQSDADLFYERAGIYAEFGKIVCVAVGKFVDGENGTLLLKTKAYAGDDERALLADFKTMVEKLNPATEKFCAHNGKEFDFPYLCRRMLVNGIALPAILNLAGKKSWEVPHLDTMELWKFGDYKHFTSLDLLATLFEIPSSKSDMDGSQVNHVYYAEKGLTRIKEYCLRDVAVLAQVFLKLKGIALAHPLTVQASG